MSKTLQYIKDCWWIGRTVIKGCNLIITPVRVEYAWFSLWCYRGKCLLLIEFNCKVKGFNATGVEIDWDYRWLKTLFNSLSKVPKEEKVEENGPELLKKKKRKVDEGKHWLINKIKQSCVHHLYCIDQVSVTASCFIY